MDKGGHSLVETKIIRSGEKEKISTAEKEEPKEQQTWGKTRLRTYISLFLLYSCFVSLISWANLSIFIEEF